MQRKNLVFLAILGIFILAVTISVYIFAKPSPKIDSKVEVTIGSNVIAAEVADSPSERSQGLSNRTSLPENHGMLFVFESPGKHVFWMKDMKFSLDFIWIADGKVVDLDENISPEPVSEGEIKTYAPDKPVKYVLEVAAGYVQAKGIGIGDVVRVSVFEN